jgi:hypothetical protein
MAAVQAIADAQAKYPELDMSKLEDITKLKAYTEEVSLFKVSFCSEIVDTSQLCWHKRSDNSYRLLLPAREQITIQGNLLGDFSVQGVVVGQRVEGKGFKDLPDALAFAEKHLSTHGKSLLTLLRRESKWHSEPKSEGQLKLLRQFRVPEAVIAKMSKGDSAKFITMKLGSRR